MLRRWYLTDTTWPMSRSTAKARVFVRFLCAGFNLEGNRGDDREEPSDETPSGSASGLLAHNVAGIHYYYYHGDVAPDKRGGAARLPHHPI